MRKKALRGPNYMATVDGKRPNIARVSPQLRRATKNTYDGSPAAEASGGSSHMKKTVTFLLTLALVGLPAFFAPAPARADNKDKDEDRLQNAGQVIKEILDIPDDIPQNLLDKADCVVVIPTVLKAAFIVGAS